MGFFSKAKDYAQRKYEERQVALATAPERWHSTKKAIQKKSWKARQNVAIRMSGKSSNWKGKANNAIFTLGKVDNALTTSLLGTPSKKKKKNELFQFKL